METYRINIGVNLNASSLDDIKEIVFKLRALVAEAARGKATGIKSEILGCEVVKKGTDNH